jgi:hypothetical protein
MLEVLQKIESLIMNSREAYPYDTLMFIREWIDFLKDEESGGKANDKIPSHS